MADLTVHLNPDKRNTKHMKAGQTVEFHTTQDCRLRFTNPAIFNKDYLDLTTGKPITLTIASEGETAWTAITPIPPSAQTAQKASGGPGSKDSVSNPNEIVVP
jgi:hypothetical protein